MVVASCGGERLAKARSRPVKLVPQDGGAAVGGSVGALRGLE